MHDGVGGVLSNVRHWVRGDSELLLYTFFSSHELRWICRPIALVVLSDREASAAFPETGVYTRYLNSFA